MVEEGKAEVSGMPRLVVKNKSISPIASLSMFEDYIVFDIPLLK